MQRNDFRLRVLLLRIDENLSMNERKELCFLFGPDDVPRRLTDVVIKDPKQTLELIWETLFDREKINAENVNYLVERLIKIHRTDLAEMLREYSPVPFSYSTVPLRDS